MAPFSVPEGSSKTFLKEGFAVDREFDKNCAWEVKVQGK
jgi:hypothetical protein